MQNRQQGAQGLLLLLCGGDVQWRILVAQRNREQPREQGHRRLECETVLQRELLEAVASSSADAWRSPRRTTRSIRP